MSNLKYPPLPYPKVTDIEEIEIQCLSFKSLICFQNPNVESSESWLLLLIPLFAKMVNESRLATFTGQPPASPEPSTKPPSSTGKTPPA